uniref:TIR domain-containing protein n=1 Tax=Pygocentrus nattereri TaxID=42514 RepID=A0A3B4BW38_PYGNA
QISIHPFSKPLLRQGRTGAYPSSLRAKGRKHPGQVASPSQGRETDTDSHSHLGAIYIISGGSFQNLFNLTVLRLDENQITNISASAFDPLISLVMVNLSGNHLAHIHEVQPLFQLLNIQELHIGRNGFSSFQTPQVSNTSLKLRVLDLSWNPLRVFRITADVFPHLESLGLAFSNESMTWDVQDASYLRNVSTLNLTGIEMNEEIKSVLQTFNTSLTNLSLYRLKEKILIKTACLINTLRTLHVQSSRLASISAKELIGCTDLVTLDLSENSLRNITNLAFGFMTSLKRLSLSRNKLDSVPPAIWNLSSLEVLDLSYNSIYNLTCSDFNSLAQLQTLYLSRNPLYSVKPFQNLTNLKTLIISSSRLISVTNCFRACLQKLEFLDLTQNKLNYIHKEDFLDLKSLKHLLLNDNQITTIDKGASEGLQKLTVLNLQSNKITQSSLKASVFSGLTNLKYLLLNNNYLSYSDQSSLVKPPFRYLKSLETLAIHSQGHKGMLNSCTVDKGFFCFISTTVFILLIMFSSILYHFLKWQVVYAYYRLLAFLYKSNQQRKTQSSSYQYDAFISYNTHDELWVMSELLPHVEGEQGWKLCLHQRDFQPGKPIMDNIVDGINSSRKTICVISRHYLESEWCSREIQVASFRLFDEKKDVLILVFLENIPPHQLSPYYRMRKLIKKRTYISWPKPGEDTRVFWEKLRMALENTQNLSAVSYKRGKSAVEGISLESGDGDVLYMFYF